MGYTTIVLDYEPALFAPMDYIDPDGEWEEFVSFSPGVLRTDTVYLDDTWEPSYTDDDGDMLPDYVEDTGILDLEGSTDMTYPWGGIAFDVDAPENFTLLIWSKFAEYLSGDVEDHKGLVTYPATGLNLTITARKIADTCSLIIDSDELTSPITETFDSEDDFSALFLTRENGEYRVYGNSTLLTTVTSDNTYTGDNPTQIIAGWVDNYTKEGKEMLMQSLTLFDPPLTQQDITTVYSYGKNNFDTLRVTVEDNVEIVDAETTGLDADWSTVIST